jgi:hypothetical protein
MMAKVDGREKSRAELRGELRERRGAGEWEE